MSAFDPKRTFGPADLSFSPLANFLVTAGHPLICCTFYLLADIRISISRDAELLVIGLSNIDVGRPPDGLAQRILLNTIVLWGRDSQAAGLPGFAVVYETALCSPRTVALYQRVPASRALGP
jgi:hypothetical protein